MCTAITITMNNSNNNISNIDNDNHHLSFRREAIMRRQMHHKLTSFRLPKETTVQLLHFHCNDEPENDDNGGVDDGTVSNDKTTTTPATCCPLNIVERRKRALQRNRKNMTSFRLPKNKTHQLLAAEQPIVVEEEEGEEEEVRDPVSHPINDSANSNNYNDNNNKNKSRRCRALQLHNQKHTMTSFRLPKEQTKPLLHIKFLDDEDDNDNDNDNVGGDGEEAEENDCGNDVMNQKKGIAASSSSTGSNGKSSNSKCRAMPPQLVRQSSFSARTA